MSIRVNVDPSNPGQFFACCGLLELADRLWNGAEGWFENDGRGFRILPLCLVDHVNPNPLQLATSLAHCSLTNTMTQSQLQRLKALSAMPKKEIDGDPLLKPEKKLLDALWRESPVVLGAPFNLRIDWFLDDRAGGDALKTWAGLQAVIEIANGMRSSFTDAEGWGSVSLDEWLFRRSCSDDLPFNFDSNLGGIGGDRDIGFSFDPLKNAKVPANVQIRPLVELLAFIGLQRFRPLFVRPENRFRYWLWFNPMAPEIASAAACGSLEMPNSSPFEFRLLHRTMYLKSFLPAIPVSRSAQ